MNLCSAFSSQIAKSQPWAGGIAGLDWREILWVFSFHSWRASEGIMQMSALKKALVSPCTASLGALWTSWHILIQTRLNIMHTLPFAAQLDLRKIPSACFHCHLASLQVSLRSGQDQGLRMGSYWRMSSILQAGAFSGHPAQVSTKRTWTYTSWSYHHDWKS